MPHSFCLLSLLVRIDSLAVHPTLLPLSLVASAVRPDEITQPMSMIHFVAAFVYPTVRPLIPPVPVHHVIQPRAVVTPAIRPLVFPLSTHFVTDPLACVR